MALEAFDALAPDYDREFTHSLLGTLLRQAVWRRLEVRFGAGERVLELNCGTGEDAVFLGRRGVRVLATDGSREMVEVAREKVVRAGLTHRVEVREVDLEHLQGAEVEGPFRGALSNFGGLNCVGELEPVARWLASRIEVGGVAMLTVMGPLVPWEWGWFLARGRAGKAFRRLRPGGVEWRGQRVRYPSVFRLRRAFAPSFRLLRVAAVGALVPPSYVEAWACRHRAWVERLNRWERRCETRFALPWLADHYLAELERVDVER